MAPSPVPAGISGPIHDYYHPFGTIRQQGNRFRLFDAHKLCKQGKTLRRLFATSALAATIATSWLKLLVLIEHVRYSLLPRWIYIIRRGSVPDLILHADICNPQTGSSSTVARPSPNILSGRQGIGTTLHLGRPKYYFGPVFPPGNTAASAVLIFGIVPTSRPTDFTNR